MNALVSPLTWILGLVFVVVGVVGFFTGSPLLVFEVDPIHNTIHLASGIIALYCVNAGYGMARSFLLLFGAVYALVAIIGFVQGGDILGLIHVNDADNWLHTAIAAACLLVGFGSKKA